MSKNKGMFSNALSLLSNGLFNVGGATSVGALAGLSGGLAGVAFKGSADFFGDESLAVLKSGGVGGAVLAGTFASLISIGKGSFGDKESNQPLNLAEYTEQYTVVVVGMEVAGLLYGAATGLVGEVILRPEDTNIPMVLMAGSMLVGLAIGVGVCCYDYYLHQGEEELDSSGEHIKSI